MTAGAGRFRTTRCCPKTPAAIFRRDDFGTVTTENGGNKSKGGGLERLLRSMPTSWRAASGSLTTESFKALPRALSFFVTRFRDGLVGYQIDAVRGVYLVVRLDGGNVTGVYFLSPEISGGSL